MTSQGTAHGRFQRAIQRRNVVNADMAAREMGRLSLANALALCLLYQAEDDPRFERAFMRWLTRARYEHSLSHEQVELLRSAAGALASPFRPIGLGVLRDACAQMGLMAPASLGA